MNRLAMGHGYYVAPDGGSRARLYIIHGLAAFFQLRKARLTRVHSPWAHQKLQGADSLDSEGGFKAFCGLPMGRGEWQLYTLHLLMIVLVLVHRSLVSGSHHWITQ